MCYHAHCSIAYLACCADMGGIVISCDSEVKKNARQDTKEGGRWDEKRSKWGDRKRGIRRGE